MSSALARPYVFVDPFNQPTSGVTTYTRLAGERLLAAGVAVQVISKAPNMPLPAFRKRVADAAKSLNPLVIEAPETLASTALVHEASALHIRLHGSRALGATLQGLRIDPVAHELEQAEIARAAVVSAPSVAAVESSRHLFSYPDLVRCYPNPAPAAPSAHTDGPSDVDLLFLGRWQPLKGISFMLEVATRMPNMRIGVATDTAANKIPKRFVYLSASTPAEKSAALARTRVVVVPSLFESASMVGLEAIAAGRPVVTWGHVGLAEYAGRPFVFAASPWDVDEFCRQVHVALSAERRTTAATADELGRINAAFVTSVQQILQGDSAAPMPPGLSPQVHDLNLTLKRLQTMQIRTATHSPTQRKLRKLMRDPRAFLRDSKVYRLFSPARAGDASPNGSAPRIVPDKPQVPVTPVVPATSVAAAVAGAAFLEFPREGRIRFPVMPKESSGNLTALLHGPDDAECAGAIAAMLDGFTDFRPTRATHLIRGTFDPFPTDALSILNRIDSSQKENLAKIDNLALVNGPPWWIAALRSCGPHIRLIQIVTKPGFDAEWLDAAHTDALITIADHPASLVEGWRRKIVVPSADQLHVAFRRVVQDLARRQRDMLIPVINATEYRPAIFDFDASRFQGLIRLKPGAVLPLTRTMNELCEALGPHIESMLILESLHARYRTLCEAVERGLSPAQLISTCLHDGVLFDVEA